MLLPEVGDIQLHPFPVQMKHQHVQFRQEAEEVPVAGGENPETEVEIKKPEVENHYLEVQVFTALWVILYVQASQVQMEMRVFMMANEKKNVYFFQEQTYK